MTKNLQLGDHVYVSYGYFTHHGIYVGDRSVVAVCKNWKKRSGKGDDVPQIRRISLDEFADGREVKVRGYPPSECAPPSVVVERALSRVGETGYHLLTKNCEHFATWCKTGKERSSQVETFDRRVVSGVTKAATKPAVEVLVKQGVKATAKLAAKGSTRLGLPVLLVPDVAQSAVEHFSATVGGTDPKAAKALGQVVGLGTSLGLGMAVGGPIGAVAAGCCWFLGELGSHLFGD